MIAEEDLVAVQWSAQGTHAGSFHGIGATSKPVAFNGITIARVSSGKIIDYFHAGEIGRAHLRPGFQVAFYRL